MLAYITACCGKGLTAEAVEVYYDLLGEFPLESLQGAAKAVMKDHDYPTFPTVGQLHKACQRIGAGSEGSILAIEAWEMVCKIARTYAWDDPIVSDAVDRLPAKVRKVASAVGWRSIYDAQEREVLRSQFCKAFDAVAERDRKQDLLPAPASQAISDGRAAELLKKIGAMP